MASRKQRTQITTEAAQLKKLQETFETAGWLEVMGPGLLRLRDGSIAELVNSDGSSTKKEAGLRAFIKLSTWLLSVNRQYQDKFEELRGLLEAKTLDEQQAAIERILGAQE